MLIVDMPMPEHCFGCSIKYDPETRMCMLDGHKFEETFGVITSHRDKDCPIKGELVRCGECKHYKDGFCYNPNTYDDEKTCGNTAKDWFCADGERKEKRNESND